MRISFITLIAILLSACASVDNNIHLQGQRSWAENPTLPEGMNQRIEEAAVEYQEHAPVSRIGLFDIAFPSSSAELLETGGYGVLLLTALSQDEHELPPSRVYVKTLDGRSHTLVLIASTSNHLQQSENITRVLGANRSEALYSFPAYLMQDDATLQMDFAKNRDGFVLGKFSTADRDALGYGSLAERAPTTDGTPSDAIMKLIAREYPGFLGRAP